MRAGQKKKTFVVDIQLTKVKCYLCMSVKLVVTINRFGLIFQYTVLMFCFPVSICICANPHGVILCKARPWNSFFALPNYNQYMQETM